MKKLVLIFVLALFIVPVTVLAKGPPMVITLPPETYTDVNPCTGLEHDLTLEITLRIHEFENDNLFHNNTQFIFDMWTSDGFSGQFIMGPDVINIRDKVETFTFISNVNLHNKDTKQLTKFHGNTNITVVNGEVKAEVDNFNYWCAGKPS